jgi:hypothetical protein
MMNSLYSHYVPNEIDSFIKTELKGWSYLTLLAGAKSGLMTIRPAYFGGILHW